MRSIQNNNATRIHEDEGKTKFGFSRLKPLRNNYEHANVPTKAKMSNTDILKELVIRNKPYSFFITLTFGSNMNTQLYCNYVNLLLLKLNRKLFNKARENKSEFIKGFAFIEDHKLGKSRSNTHMHLLVMHNTRYDDFRFIQLKDIFYEVAGTIKYAGSRRVFNDNGVDIRKVRDDGVIEYCFKQIWDKNLSRVKFIGKGGLSDAC